MLQAQEHKSSSLHAGDHYVDCYMGGESVDDEVDGQAGRCEAEGHCWVVESEGAQDREAQYILQAHKKLYFLSSARDTNNLQTI